MLTASSTMLQFIILQRLNFQYAAWYGSIGFLGSVVGKLAINKLVKKYGKTAYIIICVAVFLALGNYALWIYGWSELVIEWMKGDYFVLHDICVT
jgi:hypothetical protein